MSKVNQENIMNDVCNLILDINTRPEEREILVDFKNQMGAKNAYFPKELLNVSQKLEQLAMKSLSKEEKMSPAVGEFYQKIAHYGQINLDWSLGLLKI